MQVASPVRRLTATNVYAMLLILALLVAAVLFILVLAPSGSGTAFSVSGVTGATCTVGGAPACFRVTVTNTGTETSNVRCEVTPASGTTAEFALGGPSYMSVEPIAPGRPLRLVLKVDTVPGSVRIYPPSVSCAPI